MDRQLYLLRNEQQEIEKRKTSVIIHGLPEAEEGKTDLDLCNELLQLLEVNADDPKKGVPSRKETGRWLKSQSSTDFGKHRRSLYPAEQSKVPYPGRWNRVQISTKLQSS